MKAQTHLFSVAVALVGLLAISLGQKARSEPVVQVNDEVTAAVVYIRPLLPLIWTWTRADVKACHSPTPHDDAAEDRSQALLL